MTCTIIVHMSAKCKVQNYHGKIGSIPKLFYLISSTKLINRERVGAFERFLLCTVINSRKYE